MSDPSLPGRLQEIYDHFTTAADSTGKQLEESRKKCENQAALWNWGGWISAILGFIVISVGFIIVFVQKANAGWCFLYVLQAIELC